MKPISQSAVTPKVAPAADRPPQSASRVLPPQITSDQPGVAPMVAIETRATQMTVVLQKIMAQQRGYHHGGLND